MKTSSLIAIACTAILVFFGLRAIRANQAIEAELAKAKKIESEIRALEQTLDEESAIPADLEEQIQALERSNRGIHKLKNEVHQLRQQTNALSKLRQENSQLTESVLQASERGTVDAETLGFVARDEWRDVGLHTPEETTKTFFHYFSRGDLREIFERSTAQPDTAPDSLNPGSKAYQQAATSMREFTSQIGGFRIDQVDKLSETEVIVHVQTAIGGESMPIRMQHVNDKWLIEAGESPLF